MAMDPKLKSDWVAALRSGEYEQGYNALQVGDKFCCLGVLCKVAGLEIGGSRTNSVIVDGVDRSYRPISDLIGNGDVMDELYNRNDGSWELDDGSSPKHTFAQIADIIEAKL